MGRQEVMDELEIIAPSPVRVKVTDSEGQTKRLMLRAPSIMARRNMAKRHKLGTEQVGMATGLEMIVDLICESADEEADGERRPVAREWVEGLPAEVCTALSERIQALVPVDGRGEAIAPAMATSTAGGESST